MSSSHSLLAIVWLVTVTVALGNLPTSVSPTMDTLGTLTTAGTMVCPWDTWREYFECPPVGHPNKTRCCDHRGLSQGELTSGYPFYVVDKPNINVDYPPACCHPLRFTTDYTFKKVQLFTRDCDDKHPCWYNGTCVNGSCNCQPGYFGRSCENVTSCKDPGWPKHGRHNSSTFLFTDALEFTCDVGYKIYGNSKMRCNANRTWLNDMPKCEVDAEFCADSLTVNHGRVLFPAGRALNSTAIVQCDMGYTVVGTSPYTCVTDSEDSAEDVGRWVGNQTCEGCDTSTLPKGTVISHMTPEGDSAYTARIRCPQGYRLAPGVVEGEVSCNMSADNWSRQCEDSPRISNENFNNGEDSPSPPPNETLGKKGTIIWAIIAALGVVLIAGAVVFFLKKPKTVSEYGQQVKQFWSTVHSTISETMEEFRSTQSEPGPQRRAVQERAAAVEETLHYGAMQLKDKLLSTYASIYSFAKQSIRGKSDVDGSDGYTVERQMPGERTSSSNDEDIYECPLAIGEETSSSNNEETNDIYECPVSVCGETKQYESPALTAGNSDNMDTHPTSGTSGGPAAAVHKSDNVVYGVVDMEADIDPAASTSHSTTSDGKFHGKASKSTAKVEAARNQADRIIYESAEEGKATANGHTVGIDDSGEMAGAAGEAANNDKHKNGEEMGAGEDSRGNGDCEEHDRQHRRPAAQEHEPFSQGQGLAKAMTGEETAAPAKQDNGKEEAIYDNSDESVHSGTSV